MTKASPQKQSGTALRPAPQLQVRSGVNAGQSLESCQRNLDYWQQAYRRQCIQR